MRWHSLRAETATVNTCEDIPGVGTRTLILALALRLVWGCNSVAWPPLQAMGFATSLGMNLGRCLPF